MRYNVNQRSAVRRLLILSAIGLSLVLAGNGYGQETKPASVLRSADLPGSIAETLKVEEENLAGLQAKLTQRGPSQQSIET